MTTREQVDRLAEALKSLRERSGMTQEAAADAMGVTRQSWSNYEAGARQNIMREDMQQQLAAAIGLNRDDLLRERDRLGGVTTAVVAFPMQARPYELPVLGKVRSGTDGPQLYGLAEQEQVADLAWIFGPTGRSLRQAGDAMSGYVESGQLVVFDLAAWPRRGEGCVVELNSGDALVAEYVGTAQGVLTVRLRQPDEQRAFPLDQVRGVYAVRLRGG